MGQWGRVWGGGLGGGLGGAWEGVGGGGMGGGHGGVWGEGVVGTRVMVKISPHGTMRCNAVSMETTSGHIDVYCIMGC